MNKIELQTQTDINDVKERGFMVKRALEIFARYVTNPGMENELNEMRQRIEEMEKQIIADLREEAKS